ncbi:MAG: 1-(5-phosphoribosyl)-5-amino-4-imidazole-carboxylate carboxylase, partial [Kiritimatiellae bacterium]|nr:1-(5-phosphoribosyl)-5-amino-4-imidazole-carboxylate carboxylase [Kiritimatiellia bacterium]
MPEPAAVDDLGFARVDLARLGRQGVAEVVFGEGKSADQVASVLSSLRAHGQLPALATRLDDAKAAHLAGVFGSEFEYFPSVRLGRLGRARAPDG